MHGQHETRSPWPAILLVLIAGCSRDNEVYTVPVTGTVTLDDTPMPDAYVGFSPIDGQAAYNTRTDEDGRFVMKYSASIEGLPPAEYRVSVRSKSDFAPYGLGVPNVMPGEKPTKEDWEKLRTPSLVPQKYQDARKSGLTANVEDGEDNDFTFALETE